MAIIYNDEIYDDNRSALSTDAGNEVIFKCAENETYSVGANLTAADAQVFYTTFDQQPASFDDMTADENGAYNENFTREVHNARYIGVKVNSGQADVNIKRTYLRNV